MMLWLLYYDKNFNDIAVSASFMMNGVCRVYPNNNEILKLFSCYPLFPVQ